ESHRLSLSSLFPYTTLFRSETGVDLSAWPTEKQFISWLGLPPGSRQSGKRTGSVKRQRNRAGKLFCTGARSLAQTVDKALGGYRSEEHTSELQSRSDLVCRP